MYRGGFVRLRCFVGFGVSFVNVGEKLYFVFWSFMG